MTRFQLANIVYFHRDDGFGVGHSTDGRDGAARRLGTPFETLRERKKRLAGAISLETIAKKNGQPQNGDRPYPLPQKKDEDDQRNRNTKKPE